MSEEIKSIDDLRKTAAMEEEVEETETEETVETEVEETENEEENNATVNKKNKFMISEDDLIKRYKDNYQKELSVGKTLEGEERLLGKGVGYCATCDAPLYRDKVVTVIGYNKEAEEEANYVSELASKVNYVAMYKDEYDLKNDIEVVVDRPLEILGDTKVNAVRFKDKEIESDGVFVLRDSISPGQLVPGLLMENGHIKVDRTMATNIPGCFAAGDCVGVPYQYIKSAGEGNIAALSAVKYLDGLGK